jgi:SAM-dependent methyltransferase
MPLSKQETTVRFYDENASEYFEQTAHLDMGELRRRFTDRLPAGAKILDAGCGSGRDSRAFRDGGFEVVSIDASQGMADEAFHRLGVEVRVMKFQDMDFAAEFDGVWASASLLHVPRSELSDTLDRIAAALKPGGILYMSFKVGDSENVSEGRLFNNKTEPGLKDLLAGSGLFSILEIWETKDVRETETESSHRWLNCLAQRMTSSDRR